MSFNLNDCKLCGETNSLVKDDNTNNTICRICGAITKENEIEEINDFQKLLIPQNDKLLEYMNPTQEENSLPQKTNQKLKQNSKKESNSLEMKINLKIEEFCKKMNLEHKTTEKVKGLTKKVSDAKKIKYRLIEYIIASIIFVICRNEDNPKTMQEISSELELDRKAVNRCFNNIRDIIVENKNQIPQTVSRLINAYCDKVLENNNDDLKKISNQISENVCKYELIAGRNPTTIAATCILIASQLLNLNIGKKIISKKIGTTENTIINAYGVLKEYFSSIVPIEYKNEVQRLENVD
jgi:transcription initiation factor TFIIIB Brf1 subunit/transcription initiation factor TFIIB